MSNLLIRNARVLHIRSDDVTTRDAHDILVKNNRIDRIQPTGEIAPSHVDTVIDADGKIAMPGLINTHSHVPMVLFRGLAEDVNIVDWFNEMWALEANLTPEDVYWGMQLGLAEMIENGVTAVADHYWHMNRAADAVEKAGTRALLGWAMFGDHGEEAIENTARFVQEYDGAANGRIRTILAPHAPYTCPPEFLRKVAAKAKEIGTGIHIHASETREQVQNSLDQHNLTPIQLLEETGVLDVPTILAHLNAATDSDLMLLRRHDTGIAHCPKTYMKLAMGDAPVHEMRELDLAVGLATDGAVSNNTLDVFESLRLMAMRQKDRTGAPETMPLHQALTIATRGSADVYQQPHDLGVLEEGRLADIILVDLSGTHHQPLHNVGASLIYNMQKGDVQTVICDGNVIMRDRDLLTLDKAEIYDQVHRSIQRLSQKVPGAQIQVYRQ